MGSSASKEERKRLEEKEKADNEATWKRIEEKRLKAEAAEAVRIVQEKRDAEAAEAVRIVQEKHDAEAKINQDKLIADIVALESEEKLNIMCEWSKINGHFGKYLANCFINAHKQDNSLVDHSTCNHNSKEWQDSIDNFFDVRPELLPILKAITSILYLERRQSMRHEIIFAYTSVKHNF